MGKAQMNSFLWMFLIVRLGYTNVVVDEIVDVAPAEAVAGAIAILPCDLSPPLPQDKVHLVIWYKDSIDMPIYSYDARGTAPEKGTHWAAETSLGERAFFRYKDVPSKLVLQNIREADAGLYRCRVDFRQSPTRNSKVNLTIILPPQKLSVLDERGAHIQHYILGPYPEGASVSITCLSTGGRPLPRVTWWQENALLDDSYETLSERRVRNVLHLERLERRHLHTVFTCQAANNQLVAPISSAVTLDLYLDPLWVRLMGANRPMSADQVYEVACEVVGSRPAPIVTWWKGNTPLRDVRESLANDGNVTLSVVRIAPSLEDAGQVLSCRATTPPAERTVLQDAWTLNIYHVPLVYLELVGNRSGAVIREGVDLLMECRIKANPWVYRVSWRHNGKILFHNASAGTVIGNQTLGLTNISRARAGIYTCVGSNQEGDGESNPVLLDVKSPLDVFPEVLRVRRSPDQRSRRRRKNREAQAARTTTLDDKKESFLTDLTVDMLANRHEINAKTENQTASQVWHRERRKRLTASRFGAVCARKDQSSCKPVVFDILYRETDNVFTRHGTQMEPQALKVLREKFGVRGRRCGVFIDPELPYLAATPDGLVGDDAIIEVKCPYRAGEFDSPLEAVRNGALPYMSAAQNGSVWLKRRALYHYQIQGQLHITRRQRCHFLIHTNKWSHYEIIERDDSFWNNKMVSKLKRFYMDCLLPEIVDPQFPANNKTDDIREGEFIVHALRKAVLNKEEKGGGESKRLGTEEAKRQEAEEAKRLRDEERRRIERQFENLTLIMRKKR